MTTKLVWTLLAAGTMLAGCATTPTTMAPVQQAAAVAPVYHVQGGTTTPAPEPVPTAMPETPTQPEMPAQPEVPTGPAYGPGCGTCVFPIPLPTYYNYGFDWLDGVLARQSDYLAGCHGFAGCGQAPAPAPAPQPHTK